MAALRLVLFAVVSGLLRRQGSCRTSGRGSHSNPTRRPFRLLWTDQKRPCRAHRISGVFLLLLDSLLPGFLFCILLPIPPSYLLGLYRGDVAMPPTRIGN